jgi:hypothetical protein
VYGDNAFKITHVNVTLDILEPNAINIMDKKETNAHIKLD